MVPEYLARLPERARYVGDSSKGEVEIVSRPAETSDMPPTGILLQDDFHTVVRDAVKSPSGAISAPMRVIGTTAVDGVDGVVVLASLEGKIVLRWIFRHGTRRWELEAARGRREVADASEDTAREELEEELGMRATAIERLGTIAGDSAILATEVDVFWADVIRDEDGDDPEPGEAMGKIESLSPDELWDRVRSGVVRDSHTLSAILHAVARGKLRLPGAPGSGVP